MKISMAKGSTNLHDVSTETFHNIDTECSDAVEGKLVLLFKITQLGDNPVMTERSVMALIKDATNYEPPGVMIMNSIDAVVEFGRGARVFEAAQLLHSITMWNKYKVEAGTLMSTKNTDCRNGERKGTSSAGCQEN